MHATKACQASEARCQVSGRLRGEPSVSLFRRVGQLLNDDLDRWDVGWSPSEAGELVWFQPKLSCMLGERWLARDEVAVVSREANRPELVAMRGGDHLLANPHVAQKFLLNLASEGGDLVFTGLNLSAGELPHARQAASRPTLHAVDAVVSDNHRADNLDDSIHAVILEQRTDAGETGALLA